MISSLRKAFFALSVKTIDPKNASALASSKLHFHIYSNEAELETLSSNNPELQQWISSEIKEKALDNVLFIQNNQRHYLIKQKPVKGSLIDHRQATRKLIEQILATSESLKAEEANVNYLTIAENTLPWTIYYLNYLSFKYTNKDKTPEPILKTVNLITDKTIDTQVSKFIEELTLAKNEARELLNYRADEFTPNFFVEYAENFAKEFGLKFRAFKDTQLLDEGLRLVYAVGKGAANKPAMISIEYFGDKKDQSQELESPVVALVGKGITFDTGGVNLKPTGFVEEMFFDKGGACAVFAAFKAAVRLGLKKNIVLVIPLAENSCGGNSYRPSDIIKSHKGLTVEITNTDAEGRLILADAMSWVQSNYKVGTLIELSTLTGACVVALRDKFAGLFSNDEELSNNIKKSGELFGEDFWPMPLNEDIKAGLGGGVSDLVNSTGNRFGGAIEAAEFLHYFVDEGVSWAHLDIAGMVVDKDIKYNKANKSLASGFGVSTLLSLLSK